MMSWNKLAQDFQQTYFFLNRNEPLGQGQVYYLGLFAAYWPTSRGGREVADYLFVSHAGSIDCGIVPLGIDVVQDTCFHPLAPGGRQNPHAT
jgi:hypothetical protein